MIALDDPIWKKLKHCYGDGSNIPPLIRRVETSKRLSKAFWDDFDNILCHQCTIGSASLAAFPHLVRIAAACVTERKAFDSMVLASSILTFALGPETRLARLDKVLEIPFRKAIKDGRSVIAEMVHPRRSTFNNTMLFLSIVAAFDLQANAAFLIRNLRLGWYHCPHCEDRIETTELIGW